VAFLCGWADESRGAPLTFTDEEILAKVINFVRQHIEKITTRLSQQVEGYVRVGPRSRSTVTFVLA
jgi:hypothetical protein